MKRLFYILLCLLVSGCAMTAEELSYELDGSAMNRRFISLRQVHAGMTRQEVASVLAFPVVTGYELTDPAGQQYQPITLTNPYRSENISPRGHAYTIEYYLAGIQRQDGQISDDELMPLVFQDDKLVDMGWDFTQKLKSGN